MKLLKKFSLTKASYLDLLTRFRNELVSMNVPHAKRAKYLQMFADAYERSNSYELASASVFDELMPAMSRKHRSVFKSFWDRLTKQSKGDYVMYQGKKYSVEKVVPHSDGVHNIYTICRMASPDGVSLQLDCLKVGATEDELPSVN